MKKGMPMNQIDQTQRQLMGDENSKRICGLHFG
jgi:hypothetical protein